MRKEKRAKSLTFIKIHECREEEKKKEKGENHPLSRTG